MLVIGSIVCFIGFLLTCGSIDNRWRRYENAMLARGIQVVRTPQWNRRAMKQPSWFFGASILLLLASLLIGSALKSVEDIFPSPLTLNGKVVSWADYKACGSNPPITCPPHIQLKYAR